MSDDPKDPNEQETVTDEANVDFPEHGAIISGGDGTERLVHDTDDDGNVIGWHKEAVTEETE